MGRKWAPIGHRPVGKVKIGYEFTYLYLTLCPFTGDGFAAFLPKLDSDNFAWFVKKVEACVTKNSLFIADGATAHKPNLFDKSKLQLVKLPDACPELNPVERFFKEVRRQLKSRVFDTLELAQQAVEDAVEKVSESAQKVISLTCFPYIKNTSP